jgi:hypothetical protein
MAPDSAPGVDPLYALVAERLKQAHSLVRVLDVSDDTRVALARQLLGVTEAAKRDLAEAARRLNRFVATVESGRLPQPPPA